MSEERARKKADKLFGQIALRLGIVTDRQLDEALESQRGSAQHKPLGLVLIEKGYVTEDGFKMILEAQKRLVSESDGRAKAVHEDSLFGKVAVKLGFCTNEQVAECLMTQDQLPPDRFMRLGDIMVIKGMVSTDQVRKILDTQRGLVLFCPQCDTQYNTVMFKPGVSLQCYRCGSALRIPTRPKEPDEAVRG